MSLKGRAVCNQARIGACRAPFLQQRHTLPDKLPQSAVSPWHQLRTLSVTLSLFVGLIVALVGTSVAFLEVRAWERNIDRGLGETARLACQSVVDELSARDEPLDPQDLRDALHDLLSADPSLDVLTVLRVKETGTAPRAANSRGIRGADDHSHHAARLRRGQAHRRATGGGHRADNEGSRRGADRAHGRHEARRAWNDRCRSQRHA